MRRLAVMTVSALALTLAGCGGREALDPSAGFGPDPVLPAPQSSLLPRVNIADAVGWPAGRRPTPAPGFQVQAFASGLEHPRWI